MKSLYKTNKGKNEIYKLYDEKLKELNISYEEKKVNTQFGSTHIIITGETTSPPIIVIHGSNGCAPIALETYANLSQKFQVFAVDVLAQPNKSAETRLSMKDTSYGEWLNEIIDKLELNDITLAGFSFGGLIILKTLEFKEDKIKEVFLSAPAYIVNGNPLKALFKIFIPMKRYMKSLNSRFLEQFLNELFSERDEFALKYLAKVFQYFEMDFTPVPVIKTKAAKKITTPITLFAAGNDMMFPGSKMIKRATKIFPSMKKHVFLKDSKHVQNQKDNLLIQELIMKK